MMRSALVFLIFWFQGPAILGEDLLVRGTEALTPEEQLARFTLPAGFTIGLFAAEPMINKPINLAVDDRGRVWVSSTVEYPYAATEDRWSDPQGTRVRESRDAIKILEDVDGDGRADRVTDFADGLNIPTGVLPWRRPGHAEGCIAWSIPNLWYFADTDGDGRADHREVLFGPLGYEKDTHGMISSLRLGPDGWVYATHGFNNVSRIRAGDGSELELHSGNVFRFRPDGSRVEIWSRGQVNPFGLAFDRRGNLYSADCHSAPVYQLIPGAVYPSFGKLHDGLGFGPAMIEHTHGSTGIAGIVYIDRGIWGAEWDDQVLIGNPVTSRINHDRIRFTGTTPRAEEQADFLVCGDPWFRPVDLRLGPEGALYVADFYNRIIGHYEVPLDHPGRDRERGRIWRIIPNEPPGPLDSGEIRPAPTDPLVALASGDPWVRRRGAEAVVLRPSVEAIVPLRRALGETPAEDTHLRHALRVALKTALSLPGAFAAVSPEDPEIASIALAVPGTGSAAWLLAFDGSLVIDPGERRRHIARHGDESAVSALIAKESGRSDAIDPLDQARAFLEIAETLEETEGLLRDPVLLEELGRLARALLARHETTAAAAWAEVDPSGGWELQSRRGPGDGDITVLSSLRRGTRGAEQHTGTLRSRPFPMPERLAFALCGHRGPPAGEAHGKNHVRLVEVATGREWARADPPRDDRAVRVEWTLPDSVGREVFLEVVDGDAGGAYAWLGLGEVEGVALPVDEFARGETLADPLRRMARLIHTTASVGLRDRLAPFLPVPPPAPPREITREERARLDALIQTRSAAQDPEKVDREKGRQLFALHCAVCHRIGGEGGLIGPQLDGIGTRGLTRLAEDILDPNRNVDAHFRLTTLRRQDGSRVAGFVAGEGPEVLTLLDGTGQAHWVLQSEVVGREVSALSLMPAGFGDLLSAEDFGNLAGWLLSQ